MINAIGIASPLVLVELAQTLSWRWPLVVLGGSLSIVGIWLFFNRGAKTSEGGLGALKLSDCLYLMRQQDFILPLLIGISVQGVYISMFVNKPFVMLNEFGLSTDSLGIALSLFAALGVVGFFIAGRSVQRIGDKGRALIGLFLEASSVALMIGAAAADSFICFILAVAAWTLALGFLLPLSAARAIDVRPTTLTAASASYGFMQTAGAALLAYLSTLSALPAVITLTMLGAGSLLLSSVAVKLSGWA